MPSGFPKFRLYQTDGSTLVYEFVYVIDINDFQDPSSFVEHTSLRGQGSIISPGSEESWDLNITFILKGVNYADLVAQMNSLQTTIVNFTKYILKVDLTPSTTKNYKCLRLQSFQFPLDRVTKRTNIQTVQLSLRVGAWG